MKNRIIVHEASQQEWDAWKQEVKDAGERTTSVASGLAMVTASSLWLATLFRVFSKKKMSPYDEKINRRLLTASTLAAAGGVWHFYRIARKAINKREATKLASQFAEQKARISGKKGDIERAKKWKKRVKRL